MITNIYSTPSLRIYQFCPVCNQVVKGIRFKRHIEKHWVTSKINEEFGDFLRRVYGSNEKIPFKLSE